MSPKVVGLSCAKVWVKPELEVVRMEDAKTNNIMTGFDGSLTIGDSSVPTFGS